MHQENKHYTRAQHSMCVPEGWPSPSQCPRTPSWHHHELHPTPALPACTTVWTTHLHYPRVWPFCPTCDIIMTSRKSTTCRAGQVLRKERCGNACCLIVGGIFIAGIIYINSCRSHSKPLNWTSSPYRTNQHTRLKKSKTSIINWNKFIQSTSVMLAK